MHVLFVHQTYPSQFGHVARYLADKHGWRCTFVCRNAEGRDGPVECVRYDVAGGATSATHYASRTFENGVWHAAGVYDALRSRRDLKPDLVVAHSGFGSSVFLPQLYACPIVNYFEYFYHPTNSDLDFRPDFPPQERERLRARTRNAMILVDLETCASGYTPTHWQRSRLPAAYQNKVDVIFDGIDTTIWQRSAPVPRQVAGRTFPEGVPLVTYAARGFEAMRGFDVFLEMAKRVMAARPDVLFLIAGEDKVWYGGDERFTGGRPFGEWALEKSGIDRSRLVFLGRLEPADLATLFSISDLHVYLTVPFILSWSVLNALACGAVVLASDTAPVREVIRDGVHGLLADFGDPDALATAALRVLADPLGHWPLGEAGAEMIRKRYAMDVCVPRQARLFERVAAHGPAPTTNPG